MASMAYLLTYIDSTIMYDLKCWPTWSDYWTQNSELRIVFNVESEIMHVYSGVARVTGARGANLKFARTPLPLKKFPKNNNTMSTFQLIMCIIISAYIFVKSACKTIYNI